MLRKRPLQKKRRTFCFAYGEKGAAHKERGAASRTTPTARGEKNGIYGENVRQRNISPPILRHVRVVAGYLLPYRTASTPSTAQHSIAQHSTAQHSTAQHSTAQHSTAQHSTRHISASRLEIVGRVAQKYIQYFRVSSSRFGCMHAFETALDIPRVKAARIRFLVRAEEKIPWGRAIGAYC